MSWVPVTVALVHTGGVSLVTARFWMLAASLPAASCITLSPVAGRGWLTDTVSPLATGRFSVSVTVLFTASTLTLLTPMGVVVPALVTAKALAGGGGTASRPERGGEGKRVGGGWVDRVQAGEGGVAEHQLGAVDRGAADHRRRLVGRDLVAETGGVVAGRVLYCARVVPGGGVSLAYFHLLAGCHGAGQRQGDGPSIHDRAAGDVDSCAIGEHRLVICGHDKAVCERRVGCARIQVLVVGQHQLVAGHLRALERGFYGVYGVGDGGGVVRRDRAGLIGHTGEAHAEGVVGPFGVGRRGQFELPCRAAAVAVRAGGGRGGQHGARGHHYIGRSDATHPGVKSEGDGVGVAGFEGGVAIVQGDVGQAAHGALGGMVEWLIRACAQGPWLGAGLDGMLDRGVGAWPDGPVAPWAGDWSEKSGRFTGA